jgi:hypothetical protein
MVLLCEVHTGGVYAHKTRARETHAYEVRAHEGFYGDLARQNTVARLF